NRPCRSAIGTDIARLDRTDYAIDSSSAAHRKRRRAIGGYFYVLGRAARDIVADNDITECGVAPSSYGDVATGLNLPTHRDGHLLGIAGHNLRVIQDFAGCCIEIEARRAGGSCQVVGESRRGRGDRHVAGSRLREEYTRLYASYAD